MTQILWGMWIIVFDFRLERIDVVNDVIGIALVAAGIGNVKRAVQATAPPPPSPVSTVISAAHILAIVDSVFIVLIEFGGVSAFQPLDAFVAAAGTACLAYGLRETAAHREAAALRHRWNVSVRLVVLVGLIPQAAGLALWPLGTRFSYTTTDPSDELAALIVILLVLGFAALIQLSASILATRRAAANLAGSPVD